MYWLNMKHTPVAIFIYNSYHVAIYPLSSRMLMNPHLKFYSRVCPLIIWILFFQLVAIY